MSLIENPGSLFADGEPFPTTSTHGDGYGHDSFRQERLMFVSGFLYAKLGKDSFDSVGHLDDSKGVLTVAVLDTPAGYLGQKIVALAREAWEALNEPPDCVEARYFGE